MSKARTLADFISDGSEFADGTISVAEVSGAAPLASPSFTGTVDVSGAITSDGLTVAGITTVQDNDFRIDLTAAPSASGEVIGDLYFRSENSYGGRQDAGLIRSISASNWNVSREAAMEFHTTYNSTMSKRMRINNNGDIVFYNADGSTTSFLYDADVGSFFNYAGHNRDFRISSDNQTNMLTIDGGNDQIGFGRSPLSGGSGNTVNEGAIQLADSLGTVPLFINGGADYAGMKLKRDGTNAAGGTDGWNWTIRPSYAAGVASGGDISYLKINSVYDAGQGGQLQHEVVFNEDQYNLDFRVESDTNSHALFVDASANEVGINQANPLASLHVNDGTTMSGGWIRTQYLEALFPSIVFHSTYGADSWGGIGYDSSNQNMDFWIGATSENISADNSKKVLRLRSTDGFIWNDTGESYLDFRVESDNYTHALFVDASTDRVGVFQGSPLRDFDITKSTQSVTTRIRANNSDPQVVELELVRGTTSTWGADAYVDYSIKNNSGAFQIVGGHQNTTYKNLHMQIDRVIFNEDSQDIDFRIESDSNANAFVIDAGNNLASFAVATSLYDGSLGNSPSLIFGSETAAGPQKSIYLDTYYMVHQIHVNEGVKFRFTSGTTASFDDRHLIKNAEVVFNETSKDSNFRVESNASTHGLYLDADDDTLCFFTGTTSSSLPSGGNFKRDGQNNGWMNIGHTAAAGDGFSYIQFMYNSGRIGQAVQSGTTGVTYQTTSDYRLKENAVPITSATERVKQLNPIRFNFISEPDRTIDGFLAHEVQTVVPEAVSGTKDEVDDNGNPEYQGLDTSRLVPVLVATIKELEARITALENPQP